MKIRNGFVSNSSSSSFIIGSNNPKIKELLIEQFDKIFTSDSWPAKDLITAFKNELEIELDYGEYDIKTWKSYDNLKSHIRNDWLGYSDDLTDEEVEEDSQIHKALFENWKYVHEITFADNGDGGSKISAVMKDCFPYNFKNESLEIKLWE